MREAESELRSNAWWLNTLAEAQSFPAPAEEKTRELAGYQTATPTEIDALARATITADTVSQLIVRSK